MDREATSVPDIRDMIKKLQGVNESAPCLDPTGQFEPDKSALTTGQIAVRLVTCPTILL